METIVDTGTDRQILHPLFMTNVCHSTDKAIKQTALKRRLYYKNINYVPSECKMINKHNFEEEHIPANLSFQHK